jgi:carboxyl-terminal processing protease
LAGAVEAPWMRMIRLPTTAPLDKSQINSLIEQEIILHYYLQKGVNQWSFSKDPVILESLNLFNQPEKFQAILAKKNK